MDAISIHLTASAVSESFTGFLTRPVACGVIGVSVLGAAAGADSGGSSLLQATHSNIVKIRLEGSADNFQIIFVDTVFMNSPKESIFIAKSPLRSFNVSEIKY